MISRFFRFIWRAITWLRIALFNLVFIALILVIAAAMAPQEVRTMPPQTALQLTPSGFLVDQYSYTDPLTQLMAQSSPEKAETRVRDLVEALKRAQSDQRITAVVMDLNYLLGGGLSKLEEIGAALEQFKTSGKPVIAFSDSFTQDQYYLASFADHIYMNPMGAVMVTGYSSYRNYFKEALDKLALNYHVFRAGTYKDAVEPLLQNTMSEASREHNRLWLEDLWRAYATRVEQQRQLEAGSVNDYINNIDQHMQTLAGDTAQLALQLNLIDHLATQSEIDQTLAQRLGRDEDNGYRALDHLEYLDFTDQEQPQHSDQVGLIVASGMILDGEQPEGNIGSETITELIRQARDNDEIKALVVRIDSGGGSAFASEVIREELQAVRDAGKPVIISMGSVAASGGYWMAMASDEVWATPTTITGSIGVFSAFPTLENSLANLGIHTDGLGTTDLAGALRLDRPLSPLASNVLQQGVEHVYQRFLSLVAQARQKTPAQIHQVAQGRVWTGNAALQLGLVDQLGNLEQAIDAAATQAGLESYSLTEIQKPLSPSEQFAQQLAEELSGSVMMPSSWQTQQQLLGALQQLFAPLLTLQSAQREGGFDPKAVYSQCLSCAAL